MKKAKEITEVESTKIRWFSRWSGREVDCVNSGQRLLNGDYQTPVHLDKMVLMMVRQGGLTA
jgi:hypothetical protein